MKNKIKYAAISVITLFCVTGHAIADTASNNAVLFDLINQIRVAPFSYALSLGYDAAFLQERNILPETVFSPYLMDEFLNSDAARGNDNMAGKNREILTNGSVYLVTAETGGAVAFFNFMPVRAACKIFIENLFKNELESKNFQHILSTEYVYAGTSITSGVTADHMNAWFCTLHLGSSVLTSEMQLLNMINQIRSEPLKIFEINDEIITVFRENSDKIELFRNEYKPLFLNASLYAAARETSFSVFNGTPIETLINASMERSLYFGYDGQFLQASVVDATYEREDLNSCVNILFSTLMLDEFKSYPENSAVFLTDSRDVGPGIAFLQGEVFDNAVFTIDVGVEIREDAVNLSKIYGLLFLDKDGNSFYSPGEELAKEVVTVYDEELSLLKRVVTDNAGHFSLSLDLNKKYFFKFESVDSIGSSVTKELFISADQFVKLASSPIVP